jgi:hypothetical protein
MDHTEAIEFVHDGYQGFVVQTGPMITVSSYDGENVYTFVGTYLQSGDCESVITKWQVDNELEIVHTRLGALPWPQHWLLFLESLPPAVRAAVAPHRDRFGFGEDL